MFGEMLQALRHRSYFVAISYGVKTKANAETISDNETTYLVHEPDQEGETVNILKCARDKLHLEFKME